MLLVAEGGRHDPLRGVVPVLVEILAFIQRQVLHERFAKDAHPLLSRPADRLMRLLAGHMDDIKRHPCRIGDHDGAVRRLALHFGRAGMGVALGADLARLHELLLQFGDDVAVFGMDQRQRPKFSAAGERGVHLVILDHQRALVGHEMLEGVDAHLHDLGHLLPDRLVPAGDRDVPADVDADLAVRLAVPVLDRVHQRPVRAGQDEIDDHRRPAGRGGGGAAFEGLGGGGPHEGHFQMGVRVDAAGDDIGAGRVDHGVALQVRPDGGDPFTLDQDVGLPHAVGGDEGSPLDDGGHSPVLHDSSAWSAKHSARPAIRSSVRSSRALRASRSPAGRRPRPIRSISAPVWP